MSRKLKSCHTLVQAFICCASIVLTKMNKWSIPYCNIDVLACRCNEGYCMFWFTETTKDESSKNWKTSLVFIVLAFDKTTTLPTHAKDQSGYLEFILHTLRVGAKKSNFFSLPQALRPNTNCSWSNVVKITIKKKVIKREHCPHLKKKGNILCPHISMKSFLFSLLSRVFRYQPTN